MENQFAGVVLGLSSALVWGAGDFCGGVGSRRASVLSVLFIGELSGLGVLLVLGALFQEPLPTLSVLLWGMGAGLCGTVGLGALYRGLATGRASIVAPASAVVSATIPAVYSAITIGLPSPLQTVGFGMALVAIVLASRASHEGGGERAFRYGLLAGIGFGAFFVLIHQAGEEGATFYPLAVARGISIPVVLAIALARRVAFPAREVLPIIVLSGILDSGGNVLFLLSSLLGRLDVATILSSLYPASTVILARIVLREGVSRAQQLGVALALGAIVLIAS
jgi:drug/metabolite transporter (DMT)-like permease